MTRATSRIVRRVLGGVVAAAMAVPTLLITGAAVAHADPAPALSMPTPAPATVTADALPTWQINGVVWSQAIVGDTVYVTGSFTKARPPGVAPGGAGEISAQNIFAFSLSTGNRVASFNHSLNAQGLVIRASADGSRVYVGGDFSSVDGQAHGHVAAFDTATNALVGSWAPNVGGQVRGLAITGDTVYVGGNFPSANGVSRTNLAAFAVSNAAMSSWAPIAAGGYVWTMTLSPDGTRVIPGGSFQTINGSPAYGMGSINTADGSVNPWPAQDKIRDAGANGAITSLKTQGNQVFGSSYAFGSGATFEGTFAVDPTTGQINWANDCLGDTYDVAPAGQVVYDVSHQHDCSVIDGWPDTSPRSRWQKAMASPSFPTAITTKNDAYGWDFRGTPYAGWLQWFPNFAFGKYTSAGQAGWAADYSNGYLVIGGEFPSVNGTAQQGLVRFATSDKAPNKVGPTYNTTPVTPVPATTAISLQAGTARVSFGSAWDMDDANLTYEVLRDNNTWLPALTQTATSNFWTLPRLGFTDTGLAPGSTHTYQLRIKDSAGNIIWSPKSNPVTISATSTFGPYANAVIADGAQHYWRLDESGNLSYDYAQYDDATLTGGYTRGAAGATGDSDAATTFNGVDSFAVNSTATPGPNVFSVEAWFRTTSTSGGKIVGFGDKNTGNSSNYDRHIYMSPNGSVTFGVYNNGSYTVTTPSAMNDGQWHQAVGTLDANGVRLYVDGKLIGTNSGTTTAQPYSGYWRIGGDSPWSGNAYFAGDIDDVAIYPSALSLTQVRSHFTDTGRAPNWPVRPSDSYGQAIWDSNPDVYWRLGDASGPAALDSSPNGTNGVYSSNGVTYGVPGGPANTDGNTAVVLGGVAANGIASANQINNPTVYSEELWFKTTTTSGGKLIGFGCAQTGNSSCYDRQVVMYNDGRLSFGTWTGQMNTADTTGSYNDGNWHYLVATQGPDGMKLYVDAALVASNPQTQAQPYSGYWRVGGDTTWGGTSSDWFAGSLDEVAIYSTALSQAQIGAHFQAGGGQVPNQLPTASFTTTSKYLGITVDGSASSDPDGTIASYAWDFGDGQTGTGATASHTYAAAGTYQVSLTVTDNRGGTNTTTSSVTVAANQAPTAAFTPVATGLTVALDGSASSDPDGTIASYAWDFGDGQTGTGATASHTYAASGTYPVTLTVTDDQGATGTVTTSVTVVAPPNEPPTAAMTTSSQYLVLAVDGSTSSDPDGTIASYAWDFGDGQTGTGATASHTYAAAGTYPVTLTVTDNQGATGTTTSQVTVVANQPPTAAFTNTVNNLKVSVDASTSSDPEGPIAGYSWNWGDGSAAGSGATASHTYAAAGTYSVTLTVTDGAGATNTTAQSVTVTAPPNLPPTASLTASASALVVNVNGSASSDPDGSIAGYSWNWGDGSAAGTGATASHTYAASGTYTVTLTVTDNQGGTGTATRSVTLTAITAYATDGFGRTVANGWGTADTGGAWTVGGVASAWSVSGGTGNLKLAAGSGYTASLNSVSSTSTEMAATVSTDRAPTGGGQYVSVIGRRISSTQDYRAKVQFAATGSVSVWLTRMNAGTESVLTSMVVPGLTYTAGDQMQMRLQVTGTSPTTMRFKIWKVGTTEPTTWQLSTTDSTAGFQTAGSVGLYQYVSGSTTNGPVVFATDDVWVGQPRP